MSFKVSWSSRAKKHARRMDEVTRARVLAAIHAFAETDGARGDVKRLQGTQNLYRLRVGDWRVIFELNATDGSISIDSVKNRGEAY